MRAGASEASLRSVESQPNAITSAPLVHQEALSVPRGCKSGPKFRQSEVRTSAQRQTASLAVRWLLLFSVGVIFTFIICTRMQTVPSVGGDRRRLADDGGWNWQRSYGCPRSPSPDFSDLCWQLGDWKPDEPMPGRPRTSPFMVESFFTELEKALGSERNWHPPAASHVEPANDVFSLHLPAAAPLSLGEQSDPPEASGSSWGQACRQVPSMPHPAPSQPSAYPQFAAADLPLPPSFSSALQTSGASHASPQPLRQKPLQLSRAPTLELESPAPTSADTEAAGEGPSTSSPPATSAGAHPHPPLRSAIPPSKHPFVRFPKLMKGVICRKFSSLDMKYSANVTRQHSASLRRLRLLLLRSELNKHEAEELVRCSEELVRHAYSAMSTNLTGLKPVVAAERLGRRFLILHALSAASQAVGQQWQKEPWWKELAARMPTEYSHLNKRVLLTHKYYLALLKDLSAAMTVLKQDGLLPDDVVIDLKRRLLCSEHSPPRFKTADLMRHRQPRILIFLQLKQRHKGAHLYSPGSDEKHQGGRRDGGRPQLPLFTSCCLHQQRQAKA
ncbi:hypothetical protein Efla_001980 [Eimeria flavescens]